MDYLEKLGRTETGKVMKKFKLGTSVCVVGVGQHVSFVHEGMFLLRQRKVVYCP